MKPSPSAPSSANHKWLRALLAHVANVARATEEVNFFISFNYHRLKFQQPFVDVDTILDGAGLRSGSGLGPKLPSFKILNLLKSRSLTIAVTRIYLKPY